MICASCRDHRHGECRGGSWCDCQHRPGSAVPGGRPESSGDGRERGSAAGEDGEPPVNWVRQG